MNGLSCVVWPFMGFSSGASDEAFTDPVVWLTALLTAWTAVLPSMTFLALDVIRTVHDRHKVRLVARYFLRVTLMSNNFAVLWCRIVRGTSGIVINNTAKNSKDLWVPIIVCWTISLGGTLPRSCFSMSFICDLAEQNESPWPIFKKYNFGMIKKRNDINHRAALFVT